MALNIKSKIRGSIQAYREMPLWKRILWGVGVVWGAFVLISVVLTIFLAFIPVVGTPLMVIRAAEGNRASKEVLWKKDWVGRNKLSDHLKLAVICAEDQNFLTHHGFDLVAIEKALKHNKKSRRKRGASTISQQTAKNVFLWPGRSWVRKGLEVWFTGLIEVFWSKQRILTVYLNIAEMGKGIYGAEAASQHYFKKSAAKLTRAEAALLASILPSPMRYSVSNPGPYVRKRQAWIMRQMQMQGGVATMRTHPNW